MITQAVRRARRRAEALAIEDQFEALQGEIIGWAEYSLCFELRLHADRSVVVGTVSREAVERLVTSGAIRCTVTCVYGSSYARYACATACPAGPSCCSRSRPSRLPDWPARVTRNST